jgi:hypothetical protein
MVTIRLCAAVASLLLLLVSLSGCDQHAMDKMAIKRVLSDFKNANIQSNGKALSGLLTPESFTAYSRVLFIAPAGKKEDILKLTPVEVVEVVRIRARMTRKQLAGMDGLAYQEYATSNGWYTHDEGLEDDYRKIVVAPDGLSATARLYDGRVRTNHSLEFRKVNGKWLFHEPSVAPFANDSYNMAMQLFGDSMAELALEEVSGEVGRELGDEIWQPMKP